MELAKGGIQCLQNIGCYLKPRTAKEDALSSAGGRR